MDGFPEKGGGNETSKIFIIFISRGSLHLVDNIWTDGPRNFWIVGLENIYY